MFTITIIEKELIFITFLYNYYKTFILYESHYCTNNYYNDITNVEDVLEAVLEYENMVNEFGR